MPTSSEASMRSMLPVLLLLAVACRNNPDKPDTGELSNDCDWYADNDGDGYGDPDAPASGPCEGTVEGYAANADDCDDDDAGINPAADDSCNGLDDDCDGEVDEGLATTWYVDADGDGHGDPDSAVEDCEPPDDHVDSGGDCDDSDPEIHPDAPERCDGVDNDCDGEVDEDLQSTWYLDADGDGFGATDTAIESCDPGEGWVDDASDCDDGDDTVHPDAEEVCNDLDDDCDGETDEGLESTWYADADSDGFGDPDTTLDDCDPGAGWVDPSAGEDCDDANSSINPAATEACNGYDDDCDGLVDDDDPDVVDSSTWYADADGDGYGDDGSTLQACTQPSGTSSLGGDCDDEDTAYNPGATEDDCTDPTDYNCDGSVGWADDDGDGWAACEDCDDGDASVNPDGEELCNGVDDDCDGDVDEDDATDVATWYADTDGDGYGDAGDSAEACAAPSGYTDVDTDCDDDDATVHPAAAESCNGVDDDCDGTVDEGVLGTWYADSDGDGYGDTATTTEACEAPSGYTDDATDCDDGDAEVNPDADEVCNGADDDCDGDIDEDDAVDVSTWYADGDGDGYGDAGASTVACSQPSGYVSDDTDCDDGDAAINPAAAEVCDGDDNDCDGDIDEDDATDASSWYLDADGDGYGEATSTTDACTQPTGYVSDATDCDDSDTAVSPTATEVCDGIDNDCDGDIDDDDSDLDGSSTATWYADGDSDGYGDATSTTDACSQPTGYVSDATDCDDGDANVNPGAAEDCDGVDQDCSGSLSWLEEDVDGDGLMACELSLWLRSDSASNNDPATSGSHGSSQAAALLAAEGLDFDTADTSSTTVTANLLDNYGLLVMNGTASYGTLDSSEATVLEDWVRDGGSLLYMAYHPSSSTCAMVNSLPSAFGLSCTDYSTYWSGTASSIVSHAVTADVSSVVGMGGEYWNVSSPSQVIVDYGGWPVVFVLELDEGRVVGVSDEWPFYDSGTGSADIGYGDNQTLVENIWAWLADFAL